MFRLAVFFLLVAVAATLFSFSSAVGVAAVTARVVLVLAVAFFLVTVFLGVRDPRL